MASSQITLVEKHNPDILLKLLSHEGLNKEQKALVLGYYNGATNGNEIAVTYDFTSDRKEDEEGRLYGRTTHCYQRMWKDTRNLLAAEFYVDIDMANSQPTILAHIAAQHGWVNSNLTAYVQDREARLAEWGEHYGLTRGEAKDAVLKLMFLGGLPKSPNGKDACPKLKGLRKELLTIAENLKSLHPAKYNKMVEKHAGHPWVRKPLSSLLSSFLLTEENRVLMTMKDFFEGQGCTVGALMYDGMLVEKQGYSTELLAQCEGVIKEQLGIGMALAQKPMISTIVLPSAVPEGGDPMKMLLDGKHRCYEDVKALFELQCFKIMSPVAFCRVVGDALTMYSKSDLKTAFANVFFYVPVQGTKTSKRGAFVDAWLVDTAMRTYTRFDHLPPPLPVPEDVFNTWSGFPIDKVQCDRQGDVQPFLDHVSVMTSFHKDQSQYVIYWLAQMIQQPGILIGILLVFVSLEGAGKGSFLELLKRLIGTSQCYESASPEIEVFGKHAEGRKDKLLIALDEAHRGEVLRLWERIKNAVTARTWNYEPKGFKPTTLTNLCRYIFFSNNSAPTGDGRRVFVSSVSPKYIGNRDHWRQFYEYIADDANIKAIMAYLRSVDIQHVDWNNKPISEAAETITALSTPILLKFLQQLYYDHHQDGRAWKMSGECFGREYCNFCMETLKLQHFNEHDGRVRAPRDLSVLYIPECKKAIKKVRTKRGVEYHFEPELLKDYLRSKGLLQSEEEDSCYFAYKEPEVSTRPFFREEV